MVVLSNVHPYEVDEVKQAAKGRWAEIHEAAGIPIGNYAPGKQGSCPKQCLKAGSDKPGGVDRFCLFDDYYDTGGCRCRVCDQYCGTGFDALTWWHGWTFAESLEFVAKHLGITPGKSHNHHVASENGIAKADATTEPQQAEQHVDNDEGEKAPQPAPTNRTGPDFLVSRTAPDVSVSWDQVDSQTQHTRFFADLLAAVKPGIDPDAAPGGVSRTLLAKQVPDSWTPGTRSYKPRSANWCTTHPCRWQALS